MQNLDNARDSISRSDALNVWLRVAALSFGGPASQIAVMHRILVDEKKWISEARFLHALNYCILLPGPEAQKLATYIGWLIHRTSGGLMAGLLFIAPGFVVIMALSILYAGYGHLAWVTAVFFGLKAAILAVVVEAVVRIGKRALKNNVMIAVAVSAFIAKHTVRHNNRNPMADDLAGARSGLLGMAGTRPCFDRSWHIL